MCEHGAARVGAYFAPDGGLVLFVRLVIALTAVVLVAGCSASPTAAPLTAGTAPSPAALTGDGRTAPGPYYLGRPDAPITLDEYADYQ